MGRSCDVRTLPIHARARVLRAPLTIHFWGCVVRNPKRSNRNVRLDSCGLRAPRDNTMHPTSELLEVTLSSCDCLESYFEIPNQLRGLHLSQDYAKRSIATARFP